jgi:hypothetical protein
VRSRLALAASVALLLAAGFSLPARFTSPEPGLSVGGGDAHFRPFTKVKSSMSLEQGPEGRTGFRIIVEELPPGR